MHYVYLLESEAFADRRYVGVTSDLKQRLTEHNMGKTQGLRAFVTQIVGASAPFLMGYVLQLGGGFTGGFAGLAVAVVISAGCMITLAREGF